MASGTALPGRFQGLRRLGARGELTRIFRISGRIWTTALARWLSACLTRRLSSPNVWWYSGTSNSGSYPNPPVPRGSSTIIP